MWEVFQRAWLPAAYHCQLTEALMAAKGGVIEDLISVIAHGTQGARIPAANLLFYYWPNLNPTLFDRKGTQIKLVGQSNFNDSLKHTNSYSNFLQE